MKKIILSLMTSLLSTTAFCQITILSSGDSYLPAGKSYWIGASSDAGNRLRMHHNGSNAYIDFYPNIYFRSGTTQTLSINNLGMVQINATTQDWWSALRVVVPTANSCAYNLNYNGSDVFFVCAQGYIWSKMGGYYGTSERKFKKDITDLTSPLNKVLSLHGVSFRYLDTQTKNTFSADSASKSQIITNNDSVQNIKPNIKQETINSIDSESNRKRIGLIVDEVEPIVPEAVRTMPDGTKAICYSDLVGLLIEAIKEQQKQIDELRVQINGNKKKSSN